jgi:hypothetical protein
MTTDSASYETPKLTEIGSIRDVTRADHLGEGQDGFLWFLSAGTTRHPGS